VARGTLDTKDGNAIVNLLGALSARPGYVQNGNGSHLGLTAPPFDGVGPRRID
jgi:hypothetical protein